MVSKTKTKSRKKGKQTKGSKKSKTTLRKRSGIKKAGVKRTSSTVARPKKVSSRRKKTTIPTTKIASPSEQETKILTEENTASSDQSIATGGTQEESEPGTSDRVYNEEEVTSPYTSAAGPEGDEEDVKDENSGMQEDV
jgi:hypothetical protein